MAKGHEWLAYLKQKLKWQTDEKSYQLSFYADKRKWKNKLLFFSIK